MNTEALFQRFVEADPVVVMLRATLENVFSPETLDTIFRESAIRQVQRDLLFSSAVDLLSLVVLKQQEGINSAYAFQRDKLTVSVKSIYNKLKGTEMQVCRALVRRTAEPLLKAIDELGKRKPKLAGYHTRIIDGNHLTSTDHRLKALRTTRSGPLPGQALVVLDADYMLVVDLFPCEDGEAQERRIFPEVIPSAQKADLWIADRNFCTTGFLFGLASHEACFVIRQHKSTLTWDRETKRRKVGRAEKGEIYEQILHLQDGQQTLPVRRITIQLDQPIRNGETEINLLTNLPPEDADAAKVAELYLTRWTIENAFQEIEQSLRGEINTLGYPPAALLGFTIAVYTYNALSLIKWAIEEQHGDVIQRQQISGYYLALYVKLDYSGMMIALPPKEWTKRFATLLPRELAHYLRTCAKHVRTNAIRKNVRGPKRPPPKRSSGRINHHVSTAQLIAELK